MREGGHVLEVVVSVGMRLEEEFKRSIKGGLGYHVVSKGDQ